MKILDWLNDLLWPDKSCPLCGRDIDVGCWVGDIRLCGYCTPAAEQICCPGCAAFYQPGEAHSCYPLGLLVVAFAPYGGIVRQRLRDLKYHGQADAAEVLGCLAAAAWQESGNSADVIVPVPLFAARAAGRGYNQSELLAGVAGRQLGLPVLGQALVRVRDTLAQYGLGKAARQRNAAGAFAPGPDIGGVSGRRVLLLDDIITTGATMQSCAGVLRECGAAEVYGLAVAGKRLDFDA